MGRFMMARMRHGLIVIIGVTVVVFVVTRMVGDPVRVMLPLEATAEQRAAFEHQLGFDRSIPVQFVDFVGELGVENICWKMLRQGGEMIVVGYGGKIEIPTLELVANEIKIGGSLVGDYTELVELMELNADGKVKMHYSQYKLEDINTAIDDFKHRRFTGRGVIVP